MPLPDMPPGSAEAAPAAPEDNIRDEAALMLMRMSPIAELDFHDASGVVAAMRPLFVPANTVFIREGQTDDTEFMALLLEGQVRAESRGDGGTDAELVISIFDPGALIGEMGLIDGAPRSTTCTALTDLKLATLSRAALRGLIEVQPGIAARLLLSISCVLCDRIRESNRRLHLLSQVTKAMNRELDATHAVNRRLLDEQS